MPQNSDGDDPFAVFGDDDDDDEEEENVNVDDNDTAKIAKSLVEQANHKLTSSTIPPNGGTNSKHSNESNYSNHQESLVTPRDIDLSTVKDLELPWPQPLYLGPIRLVSGLPCGGGRGFVATKPLAAGTLILIEEAMMEWPSEQLGRKLDLISVRHLLNHPHSTKIVHDMESLHPARQIVNNPNHAEHDKEQVSDMMEMVTQQFSRNQINELVELADQNGIRSRDSNPITSNDILRLYLCLQYNGLESGVYRHVAMLNHSSYPNCAKFLPSSQKSYSEVRTSRAIHTGESLTISYLPRVVSHASRRKHLWDQHRFDIGVGELKGEYRTMELVGNSLPASEIEKWDETSVTYRIECATEQLEQMYQESSRDISNGTAPPDVWETIKALEVSSLELFTESSYQLENDRHVLLIPCLSLHMECCALVQQAPSLSRSTQLSILSRCVMTTMKLLPLQNALLGPDHFDLARTNLDMAQAISELLSRSPKHLYELQLPMLNTFEAWSALENQCRKSYERIKAHYPYDGEEHVKQRIQN